MTTTPLSLNVFLATKENSERTQEHFQTFFGKMTINQVLYPVKYNFTSTPSSLTDTSQKTHLYIQTINLDNDTPDFTQLTNDFKEFKGENNDVLGHIIVGHYVETESTFKTANMPFVSKSAFQQQFPVDQYATTACFGYQHKNGDIGDPQDTTNSLGISNYCLTENVILAVLKDVKNEASVLASSSTEKARTSAEENHSSPASPSSSSTEQSHGKEPAIPQITTMIPPTDEQIRKAPEAIEPSIKAPAPIFIQTQAPVELPQHAQQIEDIQHEELSLIRDRPIQRSSNTSVWTWLNNRKASITAYVVSAVAIIFFAPTHPVISVAITVSVAAIVIRNFIREKLKTLQSFA
ncbi:MAG: hypothetical protein WC222_09630 [Parachlamydiales bacterium]|jgi:hypothetical protein